MNHYEPATTPTIYFIGVTTSQSSIMTVFPQNGQKLYVWTMRSLRGSISDCMRRPKNTGRL